MPSYDPYQPQQPDPVEPAWQQYPPSGPSPVQPYGTQPYPVQSSALQPYGSQPYPAQPYPGPQYGGLPYAVAAYPMLRTSGMAVAGMVIGIVALVLFWVPFLDLLLGFLAIGLSWAGMVQGDGPATPARAWRSRA